MADKKHTPTFDKPWVRVRTTDGHELDRHYEDPGIESGEFKVIKDYPPNDTGQPRETKYRTEKTSGAGPADATSTED